MLPDMTRSLVSSTGGVFLVSLCCYCLFLCPSFRYEDHQCAAPQQQIATNIKSTPIRLPNGPTNYVLTPRNVTAFIVSSFLFSCILSEYEGAWNPPPPVG
jgi:hypothetical protein